MTNTLARNILTELKTLMVQEEEPLTEEMEALDMAIKALEQEPIASPSFSYTATIKADDEQLERLQGILNGEMVIRLDKDIFDDIKADIAKLEDKLKSEVYDECRPCIYTTFEYVRQIINRTWKG